MLHDSGYVEIFSVERDETSSPEKKSRTIKKAEQCFGELTVGLNRFYSAASVGQRADKLIEIWRDDTISTRDVARIGENWYLIQQVAQTQDGDGLLVTRLTLEETDGNVWEGAEDGG